MLNLFKPRFHEPVALQKAELRQRYPSFFADLALAGADCDELPNRSAQGHLSLGLPSAMRFSIVAVMPGHESAAMQWQRCGSARLRRPPRLLYA